MGSASKKKRAAKRAEQYGAMATQAYKEAGELSKAEQRSLERRKPTETKTGPTLDKRNTDSKLDAPATAANGTRGRKLSARAPRINPRSGLR